MQIKLNPVSGKITHLKVDNEREAQQLVAACQLIEQFATGEIDEKRFAAKMKKFDGTVYAIAVAEYTSDTLVRWRAEGNCLLSTLVE
jgi:hypothetical protein